ncbi:hypothetical protein N9S30_00470, partial [bacterium]|nr:hypothetical protein [bacterium]
MFPNGDPLHALRDAVLNWSTNPQDEALKNGVLNVLHLRAFGGRFLSLIRALVNRFDVEMVEPVSGESKTEKNARERHKKTMKVIRELVEDYGNGWVDKFISFLNAHPTVASNAFLKKRVVVVAADAAPMDADQKKAAREADENKELQVIYKRASKHLQGMVNAVPGVTFDDADIFTVVSLANYMGSTRDGYSISQFLAKSVRLGGATLSGLHRAKYSKNDDRPFVDTDDEPVYDVIGRLTSTSKFPGGFMPMTINMKPQFSV